MSSMYQDGQRTSAFQYGLLESALPPRRAAQAGDPSPPSLSSVVVRSCLLSTSSIIMVGWPRRQRSQTRGTSGGRLARSTTGGPGDERTRRSTARGRPGCAGAGLGEARRAALRVADVEVAGLLAGGDGGRGEQDLARDGARPRDGSGRRQGKDRRFG
jgi:hypothetical protein